MQGQQEAVRREISGDPDLAAAAIKRHPGALVAPAERGNTKGVALLAELGYDVNLRRIGQDAPHLAAYAGNRELSELLLRLGADPTLEDNAYHAPASGWARHARHDELASWLKAVEQQRVAGAGH
jgi:ankyrin repeat protein